MKKSHGYQSEKGYLLASLILLFMVFVAVSTVVVGNARIKAELFRHYDSNRQKSVLSEFLGELIKEVFYRYSGQTISTVELQESVQSLIQSTLNDFDWEVVVEGEAGDLLHLSTLPIGLYSTVDPFYWDILSQEQREQLPGMLLRWTGRGGLVFSGVDISVLIMHRKKGTWSYALQPIAVPLVNLPYLTYDLMMPGYRQLSSIAGYKEYVLPYMWEELADYAWSHYVPYRLRELLAVRLELFRNILDPVWEDRFLRLIEPHADILDFSQESSIELFTTIQGVYKMNSQEILVNLSEYSGEQLVVKGSGKIRFQGYKLGAPLLVVTYSNTSGESLNVLLDGVEGEQVGPFVIYGMRSWRAATPAGLFFDSLNGGELAGALYLWPGTIINTGVRGHLSMHWLPLEGAESSFPLLESGLGPEFAYSSPVIPLWNIRKIVEQ